MGGGSLGSFTGHEGVCNHVTLVIRESIWNALVFLLGLPTFVDTGALGFHPRWELYHQSSSTVVTSFFFLAENREDVLKPTIFSLLLIFRFFLSFLFS